MLCTPSLKDTGDPISPDASAWGAATPYPVSDATDGNVGADCCVVAPGRLVGSLEGKFELAGGLASYDPGEVFTLCSD